MRSRHLLSIGAMVASLLVAAPAMADPDAGCGLGTVLWEGKDGKVWKLFASTTNQWAGTQTIGITLGSSGCGTGGTVKKSARVQTFVGSNFDQVARAMAVGEGETLEALAVLLEIAPSDRDVFYRLTQSRFSTIFASERVTAGDVVTSLSAVMAADSRFAAYVGG
jgi:hypothetical protein